MTDQSAASPAPSPATAKPWPVVSLTEANRILTGPGMPFEMDTAVIRGRPERVWKNAPPTLRAEVEATRAFPKDLVFMVYEDERVTFDAFRRAVAAFMAELQAAGVQKGDRIALAMRNLPEWPVAFYAGVSLGAIMTPLNAWWTGAELQYGLADSGSTVLVADAERYDRIKPHLADCPALRRVYVARAPQALDDHARRMEDVVGAPETWAALPDAALPAADVQSDDPATIFYTSGTTGKPKGALGTHRNMACNVIAALFGAARAMVRRGEALPAPGTAPQRVTLLSIPLFHVTGCVSVLSPILATAGKLVMMRRWDVERAFQLIERERVTIAGGVPTIAWQLIEHPARNDYDLSSLESVSFGGAPAAPELVRRITEAFPGSQPGQGWGMTETSAAFTNNSAEDYSARPLSCGPAFPVGDWKIMDLDGQTELPLGEVGELWAKGPNVVVGYWNKPEATAETFVDGWVRTGDLAKLDEEGFCTIIDRAKDMLIRGGENIYCIEVENALYDHPAVMDAALVGLPHRTLGEEPAAVVTLKPGAVATEDELRAFVAERLAAFKVPVRIAFHTETLPRNANGKVLKAVLKAEFAEPAVGD